MENSSLPSPVNLRRTIMKQVPSTLFNRHPLQMWLYAPIVVMMLALGYLMYAYSGPWYLMFLGSLGLSILVGAAVFLAHEALHGSITKNLYLQNFAGYIGFSPFLISPQLWRFWHNKAHHGHTNQGNFDPDSFGTLERCQRVRSTRLVTKLAPGSGHWLSYFFLFYWFTFHGQIVLWLQSKYAYAFRGFNRSRAIVESILMLLGWLGLSYILGLYNALFIILIPMILGNFTIMSYIATNHFLMPQSDHPLLNSMGITSPKWIDALHFNFSHHIEHHMFPGMNWSQTPALRRWLKHHYGEYYMAPTHAKALYWLYKTPRIYKTPEVLVDPWNADRSYPIATLQSKLCGR